MELSVLEFTDGAGSFGAFLVEDDGAAFRSAVISFEDVCLIDEE